MTEPDPPRALDVADVRRIASLARLALGAGEARLLAVELSALVGHFASLSAEPVPGSAALPPDIRESRLRPDIAGSDPLLLPPAALAPAWDDPFFVVPRSAAHDSNSAS